jgi:DNA-binding transcriptional LysR family regulator
MTLDQLRVFVAVAEHEHMTRAAAALNLTQSAVSGAIQALERRHQISLFHRVGRRIELSPDGRIFLEEARGVLRGAQNAELTLLDLAGLKRGVLNLHASQTICGYWLPQHLVRFRKRYPHIEVRLSIGNTAQVAAAINAGTAELGFIEGHVDEPGLDSELIDEDQLVVVVGASHPWVSRRRIAADHLLTTPWVLRERGSGTRSAFEAALANFGVSPDQLDVAFELPSNEAVCAAVRTGAGATAISLAVATSGILSGNLRRVPFESLKRPFMILRHRERKLSRAAQAFIERLRAGARSRSSGRA